MASYTLPMANAAWQTLTAPTADAWFQPIGGAVMVSTDASPNKRTAGIVPDSVGYSVTSGTALKVRAAGATPVSLRMWDKT